MTPVTALLIAGVYVALGRLLLSLRFRGRNAAFALLNIAALYVFFFRGKDEYPRFAVMFNLFFVAYIAMVSVQYVAMRLWARRSGALAWVAFFIPIAFLIVIRYAPIAELSKFFSTYVYNVLKAHPELSLGWVFVGISYLAFRTSYLVLEVRNGVVPMPSYWNYLGFAFFAPTILVGPISPYNLHRRGLDETERPNIPVTTALTRVIVGAVKFRFFGPLLNQLTYSGLLLDGHPHLWIDLPIAMIAYYLFLYCNFSGFCDIAIGGAGLMRIPVAENFNNPFAARNMREFWNRWHITLSQYMRDVVFSPLSKTLVRIMGPKNVDHAVAITIFVVFLLIGIWHGVGWNYAAFGIAQGIGVTATHYYTIWLKKRLGKEKFAAYNKSRLIYVVAVSMTFIYYAATLFLFANDGDAMREIFSVLRWHG